MGICQLALLRQTPFKRKEKGKKNIHPVETTVFFFFFHEGVVELLENDGARTLSLDVLSTSQIQGSG